MKNHHTGYIISSISAVINIILFGLKLWTGVLTGSIAMVADAWHTLSDTVSSLIIIAGFWISAKPKDKKHPFGHGRAEQICAIIIGTLLVVIAVSFLKESILNLKDNSSVVYGKLIIIISIISIIIKESLAQLSIRAGKKINSHALIADAWHHRSDAATSLLIIVGTFFGRYLWWIDGALGIIISLTILYASYEIIKNSSQTILGERSDPVLVSKIEEIIKKSSPEASDPHSIHLHRYGEHTELILHLKLPGNYSLKKAHDSITELENTIRARLNIEPTIHAEPL
ncbi:MAG: cation transporter [Desulfobacteraceae bacterium]|nr:cation transporter [Desulfobacteraceae bacterium]